MKVKFPAIAGAVAVVLLALTLLPACHRGTQDRTSGTAAAPTTTSVGRGRTSTAGTGAEIPAPHARGVVVDFRAYPTATEVTTLDTEMHLNLHPNSPFSTSSHLFVADVGRDRLQAVVDALRRDPQVKYAEPNRYYVGEWDPKDIISLKNITALTPSAPPNDPLYRYQWNMHKIDVEKAWTATTGRGVIVAIIDTGVAYEDYERFHEVEDLKETKFVKGWNFITGNEHANDDHGHGTHVAGTVAQSTNNGIGVVGVAPNVSIMPIKVLSARGSGKLSDIAEAIRLAADRGAKVINMSLGGPIGSGILDSAVKYAYKKGVIIVCAAGNSASENVSFPARYPQCIAVSATRYDDQLTFYTNRGKRVDIAAPGGDMNVDQNGDGMRDGILQNTIGIGDPTTENYALFQGTSMAAPHVAGAAALLVSLGVTRPEAVREILRDTARKEGLDLEKGYGGGVLDVGRAVIKTAILDPLSRFVLGLALWGALLVAWPRRRRVSLLTLIGVLTGSAGLFFLPLLGVHNAGILTQAAPNYDIALAGLNSHANALFWSALLPFGLAVCTFGERRLQDVVLGLSVGVAAFLLSQVFFQTADLHGVSGWLTQKMWLLANAGTCMFLAYVLGFAPRASAVAGDAKASVSERASVRSAAAVH